MSSKTFFWLGIFGLVATGLLFVSGALGVSVFVLFGSMGMFLRGQRAAAQEGQQSSPVAVIVLLILIGAVVLFAFARLF